jgi:hypothetical protein
VKTFCSHRENYVNYRLRPTEWPASAWGLHVRDCISSRRRPLGLISLSPLHGRDIFKPRCEKISGTPVENVKNSLRNEVARHQRNGPAERGARENGAYPFDRIGYRRSSRARRWRLNTCRPPDEDTCWPAIERGGPHGKSSTSRYQKVGSPSQGRGSRCGPRRRDDNAGGLPCLPALGGRIPFLGTGIRGPRSCRFARYADSTVSRVSSCTIGAPPR